MYCVLKTDVSNCKTTGNAIYLNPITKYETAINGCVVCKNGYTEDGSICLPYTFASAGNCSTFNYWEDKCVKCKSNFVVTDEGECVAMIPNCILANSLDNSCIQCTD